FFPSTTGNHFVAWKTQENTNKIQIRGVLNELQFGSYWRRSFRVTLPLILSHIEQRSGRSQDERSMVCGSCARSLRQAFRGDMIMNSLCFPVSATSKLHTSLLVSCSIAWTPSQKIQTGNQIRIAHRFIVLRF